MEAKLSQQADQKSHKKIQINHYRRDLLVKYVKTSKNYQPQESTREYIWCKPQLHENSCKPRQKKSSKFTKKITHVDDMMVRNFIKYLIQNRLRL